jgi:BlaI family penicillinase repressor
MRLLWERSPRTTQEIVAALAEQKQWRPRTIRTFLDRLVQKGVVELDTEENRYCYRPLVSRKDCMEQAGRSFLKRFVGGEPAALLIHLAKETPFTRQEINELKRILEDKKRRT